MKRQMNYCMRYGTFSTQFTLDWWFLSLCNYAMGLVQQRMKLQRLSSLSAIRKFLYNKIVVRILAPETLCLASAANANAKPYEKSVSNVCRQDSHEYNQAQMEHAFTTLKRNTSATCFSVSARP